MNTAIKIALLQLFLFASQAFYMYLSKKEQMIKRRNLYVLALPFVLAFPLILNSQSPEAYDLYVYSIVFCIFIAAAADVIFAILDKEYMTDARIRSLLNSYLFICMAAASGNGVSSWLRAIIVAALIGSCFAFNFTKKLSAVEIIKSLPLAILSYACSWAYFYLTK